MDAKTIITDNMTLDEKLAAIDAVMQQALNANANARLDAVKYGLPIPEPIDPASLTICDGCE